LDFWPSLDPPCEHVAEGSEFPHYQDVVFPDHDTDKPDIATVVELPGAG
jgi:hypothetical protein